MALFLGQKASVKNAQKGKYVMDEIETLLGKVNNKFGHTLQNEIGFIVNELKIDDECMYFLMEELEHYYDLNKDELFKALEIIILEILKAGALPISNEGEVYTGSSMEDKRDKLLQRLRDGVEDPDGNGVWFSTWRTS